MDKEQAEEWAEKYLEENKEYLNAEYKRQMLELLLYGTTTTIEKLSIEEVVEKYKDILTEEEIQSLNNYILFVKNNLFDKKLPVIGGKIKLENDKQ